MYRQPGKSKPYNMWVRRGGLQVSLGNFATAEEAAGCVSRVRRRGRCHAFDDARGARRHYRQASLVSFIHTLC